MKFVPNAVSTRAARTVLLNQKHSPQMLFAIGIVGFGATVVLACRATLKVENILDEHEKKVAQVGQDENRVKARVFLETTAELGKVYGPAIACGVVSVAALAGSHNILTKRNAALAAAYGTLEKAYSQYRERVRSEIGQKRELEIYHDVREETSEDEKGKKLVTKHANGGGPYSFLFDEFNKNYEPTPEYNFLFLKLQQQHANQRLQARGHLFLNEVLESLGLEHTPAGAVTGWIKGRGDDYVDFGIFEDRMEDRIVDFMVGREKAIWLDFNVDGVIYDKI
jgi:hypothetical protein